MQPAISLAANSSMERNHTNCLSLPEPSGYHELSTKSNLSHLKEIISEQCLNEDRLKKCAMKFPLAVREVILHQSLIYFVKCASSSTFEKKALILISCFPYLCEKIDEEGNHPLHIACLSNSPSILIIESLLVTFPQGGELHNSFGHTPLYILASNGCMTSQLLDVFHNMCPRSFRQECSKGKYPLHAMLQYFHTRESTVLLEKLVQWDPETLFKEVEDDIVRLHLSDGRSERQILKWTPHSRLLSAASEIVRNLLDGILSFHVIKLLFVTGQGYLL